MIRAIELCIVCFLLLYSNIMMAQKQSSNNKADTFRFKSVGYVADTFYLTREKLKKNVIKQTAYYGLSDNSNLSKSLDTFVIGKTAWRKLYKNDTIPFLSVKDFEANKKTNEYIDVENKEHFYYEYEPIKKFNIEKKSFYLYRVKPMSGKGKVEGLGGDVRYIVFDFTVGEVYRSTYQVKKVLIGYEKYVKYFKW
jgi:hypothetical protein